MMDSMADQERIEKAEQKKAEHQRSAGSAKVSARVLGFKLAFHDQALYDFSFSTQTKINNRLF